MHPDPSPPTRTRPISPSATTWSDGLDLTIAPDGRPDVTPRDLDDRRHEAVSAAVAEARGVDGHAVTASAGGAGGIAIRPFGPGRIVLALAGRFDAVGLERLRALAPMLEQRSGAELVIDLSELRDCEPSLARVIGRLRIRRLAQDASVDLRQPPAAVRRELGERPAGEDHGGPGWGHPGTTDPDSEETG
jgi:hypothetical protein